MLTAQQPELKQPFLLPCYRTNPLIDRVVYGCSPPQTSHQYDQVQFLFRKDPAFSLEPVGDVVQEHARAGSTRASPRTLTAWSLGVGGR
jgi:hypothetical protein